MVHCLKTDKKAQFSLPLAHTNLANQRKISRRKSIIPNQLHTTKRQTILVSQIALIYFTEKQNWFFFSFLKYI